MVIVRNLVIVAALLVQTAAMPPAEVTPRELEADPAPIGKTLVVLGRVEGTSRDHLRLRKSRLDFRLRRPARDPLAQLTHVALTGTLQRENGRLVFIIDEIASRPSDEDVFRRRYEQFDNHAARLYGLGDWATQLAEFYDDGKLRADALQAYERAVILDELATHAKDHAKLAELARRAAELHLPQSDVLRIKHRQFLFRFQETPSEGLDTLRELSAAIRVELPGADRPAAQKEPNVLKRYAEAPLEAYSATPPADRLTLHRRLWVRVAEAAALAESRLGDKDPLDVAAIAQSQLPDGDVADRIRRDLLEKELRDVSTLRRERVLKLAETCRLLGQPAAAARLLDRWLDQRRRNLNPGDAEGRVALADEYQQLGAEELAPEEMDLRRVAARELLLQAWRIAPQLPGLRQKLEGMGLAYDEASARWLEQPPGEPVIRQGAIQKGQINVGMSAGDVLRSRGRRPDRVVRIATRGRTSEQWIYASPSGDRLYINLRGSGTSGTPKVVSHYALR